MVHECSYAQKMIHESASSRMVVTGLSMLTMHGGLKTLCKNSLGQPAVLDWRSHLNERSNPFPPKDSLRSCILLSLDFGVLLLRSPHYSIVW
jgi:hypothetical protein